MTYNIEGSGLNPYKAATYLEALLRIQPFNGSVHHDLEYSYWQLKEHEKRLRLIETLIQWELKDIQVRAANDNLATQGPDGE